MKTILFAGKSVKDGSWIEGLLMKDVNDRSRIQYDPKRFSVIVKDETVVMFTGKILAKGQKIFNGTIAFTEEEENEGDRRIYVVCVWIEEWSMFAFLTVDEYKNYLENGFESIDEPMFWTYNLQDSERYHYAGNIFDNPELLNI